MNRREFIQAAALVAAMPIASKLAGAERAAEALAPVAKDPDLFGVITRVTNTLVEVRYDKHVSIPAGSTATFEGHFSPFGLKVGDRIRVNLSG